MQLLSLSGVIDQPWPSRSLIGNVVIEEKLKLTRLQKLVGKLNF